ncbi:MAG: YihY/virulence factor BrkB family protein [Gammaproteobacteria bacterium]|nr:YihY/virulence factor BrkB family protein [Gammaproteobacteria bacterium]
MNFAQISSTLNTALWDTSLATLPRWQAWIIQMLRILIATGRDIAEGMLTLRAMGLVYTTLLSLVPLLAVSFSVLKGFGVHNQVEPMLLSVLDPLGDKGVELTDKIIGFVDNVNVRVLGGLSLVFLFYTVISLMTKIEQSLNSTWRIRGGRNFIQRITEYLSVVMIGPILIFTGVGLTASISTSAVGNALASMEGFGILVYYAGKLASFFLIVGALTFIYVLVPNTRVKLMSAFTGAVVAALLWKLNGKLFALFVAGSTNYSAIYSSFAVVIIFMIWLYLSWLILLIGASVSFYKQNPERTSSRQQVLRLSTRLREKIGLLVMLRIGQSFHYDGEKLTRQSLAKTLDIATEALSLVLQPLEERGLITLSYDKRPVYLPAKSLEHIRIRDIWDAVRSAEESSYLNPGTVTSDQAVDALLNDINESIYHTVDTKTLLDLVEHSASEQQQSAA